ncbi:MAG: hypothetical protein QOF33_2258 [Thermomicrobiales bacterium]|jgi:uncharacterized protein (TIGR02246 family)|nr:hypothetical protein [Thermomicrobiales bacterium]
MNAADPETLHRLWVDGVNRGDLDGLMTLYEPDAAFVVRPGQVVTGLAAVRQATADLLTLQPRATLEVSAVVRAGDLALLISRWHLTGTGVDGTAVDTGGQTSDVARWQEDGTWRFAIDNPWGDAAVQV